MKVLKQILVWVIGPLLCVAGLGGGIWALVNWTMLQRYPAAVSQGDIGTTPDNQGSLSVWVYTPDVRPGDRVAVKVGAYGGLRLGIDSIEVTLGSNQMWVEGEGKDWDEKIAKREGLKGFARGSDSLEFEVEVPSDAAPGEVLPMRCRVTYTLAQHNLFGGGFSEKRGTETIEVPITVASRWGAVWRRAVRGGQALGLFLLIFLALWGTASWIKRSYPADVPTDKMVAAARPLIEAAKRQSSADESAGTMVGAIGLLWLGAYIYAGYVFFALPLLAATGFTNDWFCAGLIVLWVVGPFALALLFVREPTADGQRPPEHPRITVRNKSQREPRHRLFFRFGIRILGFGIFS